MNNNNTDILTLIVNSHSGNRKKIRVIEQVEKTLKSHGIGYEIKQTAYPGHATILAQEALNKGRRKIVAIGGDGTVNEVASALTGTEATLGIIPCGSGNGLARHLALNMDPIAATKIIVNGERSRIDYCKVNGQKFFCTFGVGYDSMVAEKFAVRNKRGLINYIKSSIQVYHNFNPSVYEIKMGDKIIEKPFYIISVCNASQYGNNAFIAPLANISDGLMDVVMIDPGSHWSHFKMCIKLFTKGIREGKGISYYKTDNLTITNKNCDEFTVHLDGEPKQMKNCLEIECVPKGLNVFVPNQL